MAEERGQKLSQMALAWVLRHENVTSVLIGASKTAQIDDAVGMLENRHFSAEELVRYDPEQLKIKSLLAKSALIPEFGVEAMKRGFTNS
jgi:aryl-alcohol dehydrogenase-like predicted oxidoreductase